MIVVLRLSDPSGEAGADEVRDVMAAFTALVPAIESATGREVDRVDVASSATVTGAPDEVGVIDKARGEPS